MNYKNTYKPQNGYTKLSQIGQSTCKRLEFGMIQLQTGESVSISTEDKDFVFIFMKYIPYRSIK